MQFIIDFGNGFIEMFFSHYSENEKDLALIEAMENVADDLTYTQCDVCIKSCLNGDVLARLPFWSGDPEPEEIFTCKFGNYGYYGEWRVYL